MSRRRDGKSHIQNTLHVPGTVPACHLGYQIEASQGTPPVGQSKPAQKGSVLQVTQLPRDRTGKLSQVGGLQTPALSTAPPSPEDWSHGQARPRIPSLGSLAEVSGTLATAGFQFCCWATCKPVQRSAPVLRALCREGTRTQIN